MTADLQGCSQPIVASRRAGLTLLEVILAVGLSAVVLALVGGAIQLHMQSVQQRRASVQQAQVARAILHQMAKELRGTFLNADSTAATDLAAGLEDVDQEDLEASGIDVAGITSSLGGSASSEEASAAIADAAEDEAAATDEQTAAQPPPVPGIYGSRTELLIDISPLPAIHEMYLASLAVGVEGGKIFGDVQSVGYFMMDGGTAAISGDVPGTMRPESAPVLASSVTVPNASGMVVNSGLLRRVVSRAEAAQAATGGGSLDVEHVRLIAPEVRALEFRYFDGQQWQENWNTELQGGIPLAVEISIVLVPDDQFDRFAAISTTADAIRNIDPDWVFRIVVRLPTAVPTYDLQPPTDESVTTGGAS